MKYTLIKISNLIQENISTNVHLRTMCLLVYAALSTKSANVSLWAARLSSIKQQIYDNCKYVLWRFLADSVFDIYRVFDLAILLAGFTKEELQFVFTYLLIRS